MLNNNILKELYPGSENITYKPMLIHSATDEQLKNACSSGDFFGQLKKDGSLYQYVKGFNGKSYLFGRTISKKTGVLTEKSANVPHIMSALDCLPNGTVLIGEIYYPGGTSKDVTPIMGCLPKKAIERQNGTYGKIHYYIHDIIYCSGVDLVLAQTENFLRYNILKKMYEINNFDKFDFIELAEVWEDNLYERIGNALAEGEEGMVLKKKIGVYEPDKRPSTNLKAKKVDFADVIIMGFDSPTVFYYGTEIENWQYWITLNEDDIECKLPVGLHYGEVGDATDGYVKAVTKPYYMGWTNSRIKIGAYDKDGNIINIGTIHSGISDEMKQQMSEHPEMYLNKVCKIQCMEKDNKEHTIRHGFFKGLRTDKPIGDCTIESIF